MNEPLVVINQCDEQIINTMKLAGYYEIFLAQKARVNDTPNALLLGHFADGKSPVVHYVAYDCKPGDSGFTMISVYYPTPEIIQAIEEVIAANFGPRLQVLYVDDPERRN